LPRWMLPSIFKYYLFLDDETPDNGQSRVSAVFSSICSKYGAQNCYLLKINSKYDDELTDPWRTHLESKYRGLEKGLVLAKEKVLSKTVGLIDGMMNSAGGCTNSSGSPPIHGQCLSYDDRENVTRMMECMVRNALIPFVEAQMRLLNEQVIARRGISKSLTTGVRKWFGAAAAQQTAAVSYVSFISLFLGIWGEGGWERGKEGGGEKKGKHDGGRRAEGT
uniref:Tom37 domain-containing protein n=1 Tax=Gongylonema pulchrum TaxID=637853 RepID=A0A183EQ09_9BILA